MIFTYSCLIFIRVFLYFCRVMSSLCGGWCYDMVNYIKTEERKRKQSTVYYTVIIKRKRRQIKVHIECVFN